MIEAIARRRLGNLSVSAPSAGRDVVELVESFGALQAQDYAAAKWALGLRMPGAVAADVDRAFDEGRLLRTHVMRPTWQFVTPATIGWLLELTAPRVHQACASWNRFVGLDRSMRTRSQRAIRAALRDSQYLTRAEIGTVLKRSRIVASGGRLAAIMLAAELDALVCSGPRRGREFTYALFEQRVPAGRRLPREEQLREMTRRYFTTHGPATLRDFSWWSGLTMASAREAVEAVPSVRSETIEGRVYWSADTGGAKRGRSLHLLPAFDEFVVGYRDRHAVPYRWPTFGGRGFLGSIFVGAELVGSWRRIVKDMRVATESAMMRPLTTTESRALAAASKRYEAFYS